jgi:putative tryptophan/tyrosine transport system substrate-binding protein
MIPVGTGQMAINIARRKFISALGGATVAWPLAAQAQQTGKLPTIGLLGPNTESVERPRIAAFVQRLGELNWAEGRSIKIEYRSAEGVLERAGEIAVEFVRLNVDVIVTAGDAQVLAAKRATEVIPIVIAAAGDPIGNGLVASLARPGGNVTGLSLQLTDTAGKRFELLREIVPGLHRLAILGNFANPTVGLELAAVQAAARTLSLDTIRLEIRRSEDIAPAFESLNGRAEALYVCADPLVSSNRTSINVLALAARLPNMHTYRDVVEAGGLISYGPDFPDLWRRAAELTDKILRGIKPADIPVEQPTKFVLAINLKTAKALGLTIPQSILVRADDVIE